MGVARQCAVAIETTSGRRAVVRRMMQNGQYYLLKDMQFSSHFDIDFVLQVLMASVTLLGPFVCTVVCHTTAHLASAMNSQCVTKTA